MLFRSVLLPFQRRDPWTLAGVASLAVIWSSTALLQIPLHNALSNGFDPEIHARLVQTNWIRTIGWTARGLIAICLLRVSLQRVLLWKRPYAPRELSVAVYFRLQYSESDTQRHRIPSWIAERFSP